MVASTQEKIVLKADVRDVFGKQVRSMRKDGIIPANIYGKGFEPKAVKVNEHDFQLIFKQAGRTSVVYVDVDGDSIPTLITDVQIHPLTRGILHADLRKVDLKKKIEADVPIKIVGESVAVAQKNGVLITQMDLITIEALPTDIPHEIEIDISVLQEIGDEITVAALGKQAKYEILDDPERVIVSVTEHVEETIEVQTTSETPEILTEKAGEEGAVAEGGAAPAEPTGSVKEEHGKKE